MQIIGLGLVLCAAIAVASGSYGISIPNLFASAAAINEAIRQSGAVTVPSVTLVSSGLSDCDGISAIEPESGSSSGSEYVPEEIPDYESPDLVPAKLSQDDDDSDNSIPFSPIGDLCSPLSSSQNIKPIVFPARPDIRVPSRSGSYPGGNIPNSYYTYGSPGPYYLSPSGPVTAALPSGGSPLSGGPGSPGLGSSGPGSPVSTGYSFGLIGPGSRGSSPFSRGPYGSSGPSGGYGSGPNGRGGSGPQSELIGFGGPGSSPFSRGPYGSSGPLGGYGSGPNGRGGSGPQSGLIGFGRPGSSPLSRGPYGPSGPFGGPGSGQSSRSPYGPFGGYVSGPNGPGGFGPQSGIGGFGGPGSGPASRGPYGPYGPLGGYGGGPYGPYGPYGGYGSGPDGLEGPGGSGGRPGRLGSSGRPGGSGSSGRPVGLGSGRPGGPGSGRPGGPGSSSRPGGPGLSGRIPIRLSSPPAELLLSNTQPGSGGYGIPGSNGPYSRGPSGGYLPGQSAPGQFGSGPFESGPFGPGSVGRGQSPRGPNAVVDVNLDASAPPLSFEEQEKIYNGIGGSLPKIPADPVSVAIAYKQLLQPLQNLARGGLSGKDKYPAESTLHFGPKTIPADGRQETVEEDVPEEKLNIVDKPVVELKPEAFAHLHSFPASLSADDGDLDDDMKDQNGSTPGAYISYSDLGYSPIVPDGSVIGTIYAPTAEEPVIEDSTLYQPSGPPLPGFRPGGITYEQDESCPQVMCYCNYEDGSEGSPDGGNNADISDDDPQGDGISTVTNPYGEDNSGQLSKLWLSATSRYCPN